MIDFGIRFFCGLLIMRKLGCFIFCLNVSLKSVSFYVRVMSVIVLDELIWL